MLNLPPGAYKLGYHVADATEEVYHCYDGRLLNFVVGADPRVESEYPVSVEYCSGAPLPGVTNGADSRLPACATREAAAASRRSRT